MEKKKVWTWFYMKKDNRLLGYIYNPYLKRDKKDLVETMGLINGCKYSPDLVRLVHLS